MQGKKKKMPDLAVLLKMKKLKATAPRLLILELLAKSEQPQAADTIFEKLKKINKSQKHDLVTLYRNLNSFVAQGILISIDLGLGKIFYEFSGNETHHHHHVVCEKCHKIEHLDVCGLGPYEKLLEGMGYTKIHHRMEFFGICRACA